MMKETEKENEETEADNWKLNGKGRKQKGN
jgi:hypothetical protein